MNTESDVLDDPGFVRALAMATVRALIETSDAETRREIHERLFEGVFCCCETCGEVGE